MLTCKLCNTILEKKHLRRDGSMLCPECGQIYWKEAVEKAMREPTDTETLTKQIVEKYRHESIISAKHIARSVA